jgi:N-acetyl-anhydromuramyl-L-alanine amidase AmpD
MDIIDLREKRWAGKPMKKPPEGVIVHSMGENLGGVPAEDFLRDYGLSVHALIKPDGTIIFCQKTTEQAWHAGVSEYMGKTYLNRYTLGVELLLEGDWTGIKKFYSRINDIPNSDPYSEAQYDSCIKLLKIWKAKHPSIQWIAKHSRVSGSDVRGNDAKRDPGQLCDWTRIYDAFKTIKS